MFRTIETREAVFGAFYTVHDTQNIRNPTQSNGCKAKSLPTILLLLLSKISFPSKIPTLMNTPNTAQNGCRISVARISFSAPFSLPPTHSKHTFTPTRGPRTTTVAPRASPYPPILSTILVAPASLAATQHTNTAQQIGMAFVESFSGDGALLQV